MNSVCSLHSRSMDDHSCSIIFDTIYWLSSWTDLLSKGLIIAVWYQITRSSLLKNTLFWSRNSQDPLSVVSLDAKYTMTEINAVDIRRAIRLFLQWTSIILKRINRNPIKTPHEISTVSSSSLTRLDLASVHYRRLALTLSSSSYIIQIFFTKSCPTETSKNPQGHD